MHRILARFTPSGAPPGRQPKMGATFAILGTAFGVVATLKAGALLTDEATFLLFIPGIVAASAFGGLWTGAFSVLIAAAAGFWVSDGDLPATLILIAVGAAITTGGEWFQRARDRAHAINIDLANRLEEQRRAEARARELQSDLVHMSRLTALGEMASALAHELNQPLSAVTNYMKGASRLLASDTPPLDKMREAVSKAGDQALRAGDIIRRLRDFVSRGETERRIESLQKMIKEAAALALVGAREHGVRSHFRFDPAVDLVLADRVQVQQVALNLIRNAVDAMEGSPRRELTVVTEQLNDGLARISVSDTGPGVSDEVSDQLFQPFVTTKRTGMGVGLSISRTIVEAHGGRIWVEPNPGGGSIFRFTLQTVTQEELDG